MSQNVHHRVGIVSGNTVGRSLAMPVARSPGEEDEGAGAVTKARKLARTWLPELIVEADQQERYRVSDP
jgi:hypothetical protein